MFIYNRKGWPEFTWDMDQVSPLLVKVRHMQGRLMGRMGSLGFQLRNEASLQSLTQDVLKTSEIEGEKLNLDQVRSSLAKRLGIDVGVQPPIDRNVEGIVEIMLDATGGYSNSLTKGRLSDWHAALFPTGRSGLHRITVGGWRDESSGVMQVVSGGAGREKVHFEAPSYRCVSKEMSQFIKWFNKRTDLDSVLKAALAHFWFITIHPFDDGNGRIARAITDMVLARSEESSQRFYSMSSQIQLDRDDYYDTLERCQKGLLDITDWMVWFLGCLGRAIESSDSLLESVLVQAQFWERYAGESFNDRQRLIVGRLLGGFKGKMTSSKWAKLGKCSQDTALRDIQDLLNRDVLIKDAAGGRSTSYRLNLLRRSRPM